ncbi:hypothetical protein BDR07DRAFT_1388100 [Suillus spraguei]|nr:hypothetical protein BDR07DRAFT_1388100 [Suillus spraguei]
MSFPEAILGAYPDTVQPDRRNDDRLHSRIVEILASTTNGCLEELGLHPTVMEKLQKATQLVQSLQEDNGKLYQDNCQLAVVIQTLKERIAHISASPDTRLQQFYLMQERIRTLENERVALARKNEEILLSVNKGTSHHHLVEELNHMKAFSNRVRRDMQILQDKYALATQRNQSSLDSVPQIGKPRIPTPSDVHQRRMSAEGAPLPQPSRVSQQQAQYFQQMRPQDLHTQPPHQLPHAQRRVSDGVQNPYPPQQPLLMSQRRRLPPPASAPPMFGARSPTEFAHMPSISSPVNPSHPQHPRMRTSQTVYRNTSAPLVPFDLHPNLHTATSRPILSIDLTGEDERIRMMERASGVWVDQPSSLKRTNSAADGSVAQNIELIKRQRTVEPIQSPEGAIVDVNAEPKLTSPDTVVGSKPTSPVAPSLSAPLIKEEPDAVSAGEVGVTNDEVATAVTPSDTVVGSNPTSPSSVTPSAAQEQTPGPSASGDNLRPVEACVYLIYEPDAEVANGYFCGRCLDRFEMGMIPEQPDVLVNPRFEDLIVHCTQEHPTIWEDLRHKRDLEPPPPPPS